MEINFEKHFVEVTNVLNNLGISIFKNESKTDVKSTYEILEEIATVYSKL